MNSKELMLQILTDLGVKEASELREIANTLSATEVIDQEHKIPDFNPTKDYSDCPVGTPVRDQDQIFGLITPHNASSYSGTPMTLRALWSLLHTKNPLKAKAWVDPEGTSGMYMIDECYLGANDHVYKCLVDNCVYDYEAYPSYWEDLGLASDLEASK